MNNEQFIKSYFKEARKQELRDPIRAEWDCEHRQAPLKIFNLLKRDDYSFNQQRKRVHNFSDPKKIVDIMEKIEEVNNFEYGRMQKTF